MISTFSWRAAEGTGVWGNASDLPAGGALPDVLWIDLEAPTPEEEALVLERYYPVHPLTLEDIQRPRRIPGTAPHFPKVEEFPGYLFVIVNPLIPLASQSLEGRDAAPGQIISQLSAVLNHQVLITHHYEPLVSINELRSYLEKHGAHSSRGPDFLFHLVLDQMVDQYAPLLDELDDSLDEVEVQVFTRPSGDLLSQLLGMKRTILSLRKTMIYEREVLARMSRGEFALIDEREMVYYRNVYDHLIRFTELIEASREMVMDLMQTLLAAQGNKLNQIMKVLTMISTTILPMSLIAGVYGMNFEKNVWPDYKDSSLGFWGVVAMMAVSGLAALGLFRWLRWV